MKFNERVLILGDGHTMAQTYQVSIMSTNRRLRRLMVLSLWLLSLVTSLHVSADLSDLLQSPGEEVLLDDNFDNWKLSGTHPRCHDNWYNRDMFISTGYKFNQWGGNKIAEVLGCKRFGEAHLISPIMDTSNRGKITIGLKRYLTDNFGPRDHLSVQVKDSNGNWVTIAIWQKNKGADSRWHSESFTLTDERYFHSDFQIRFTYRGRVSNESYAGVDDVKIVAEKLDDLQAFRLMAVGCAHIIGVNLTKRVTNKQYLKCRGDRVSAGGQGEHRC